LKTPVEPVASRLPHKILLCQNYPNPFNPSTTIKFELPGTSDVRLTVYDMVGREVSVLVNEKREAGVHEVKCDGSNLASGVYFYRLQVGVFAVSRKLLILK
jgi:Secretion system C-terminal sorting domain